MSTFVNITCFVNKSLYVKFTRAVNSPHCVEAEYMASNTRSPWRSAPSASFLSLSSLELSHAKICEPQIRALFGTASHFCEVLVLESRSAPSVVN